MPRVARWAHRHALGVPGACVSLLEFLVRSGAARFVAGSWELQEDIDSLQLPEQAADKLELALPRGTPGRSLLEVLSLVTRPFPLDLSAYVAALPEARAASALDDLVRAERVLATSRSYVMRDYASLRWARDRLEPARAAELHRALARVYAAHGQDQLLQLAYHQWQAGDRDAADQHVRRLQQVSAYGLRDLVWSATGLSVPAEFLEELLAYRKQQNASPADLYALRGALLAIALMTDMRMIQYGAETLEQLRRDVGLDLWEETDPALEPLERVFACVAKAGERAQTLPESQQSLPPERALAELVRCIALLNSPCSFTQDIALVRTLSELMAPLAELSPTSRLIAATTQVSHDTLVYGARCIERRRALIEASTPEASPDVDPITRDAIHCLSAYYVALDLAADGCDEALVFADELEQSPVYEVLALQIRRIHALGCGRFEAAQRYRRRRELLSLRTQRGDNHLRFAVLREVQSAFRCSDMLELSRTTAVVEERAAEYPGWRPWAALTRAYMHLRADEPSAAVELLESVLVTLRPFSHNSWHNVMTTLAEAKNELRDYARARELASTTLEGAAGLGITLDTEPRLRAALALSEAGLGDPKGAAQQIAALLEQAQHELGRTGVMVGMLRETACQIALLAKDYNSFSAQLDALGEHFAHHPGLRARHARWVRRGKDRFRKLLAVLEKANAAKDWSARIANQLAERTGEDGSEYLLSFVLDELQIDAGQLYRVDPERRFSRLAARPEAEEPQLLAAAIQTLERWWKDDEVQTADEESETAIMQDSQGRNYIPLWLTRPGRAEEVSGLLLLNCSPDRLAKLTPAFVKAVAVHLEALA